VTAARHNPFRVERLHSLRYRSPLTDWPTIMRQLEAQRYVGAVVGPHGTGKTTLFLELRDRLTADGWRVAHLRLNVDAMRGALHGALAQMHAADSRTIVMLDGADLLGTLGWWRVKHRWRRSGAGGLLITSHRTGLLPTLVRTAPTLPLMHELVDELVGPAAGESLRPRVATLYEQHQGNMRDVLRSLYDGVAQGQLRV
jgi:hypothetical protein